MCIDVCMYLYVYISKVIVAHVRRGSLGTRHVHLHNMHTHMYAHNHTCTYFAGMETIVFVCFVVRTVSVRLSVHCTTTNWPLR